MVNHGMMRNARSMPISTRCKFCDLMEQRHSSNAYHLVVSFQGRKLGFVNASPFFKAIISQLKRPDCKSVAIQPRLIFSTFTRFFHTMTLICCYSKGKCFSRYLNFVTLSLFWHELCSHLCSGYFTTGYLD